MNASLLKSLLEGVREGTVSVAEALERLKVLPYQDLGFARVDQHRALRHGFPEVVYGSGKSPQQIAAIISALLESDGQSNILVTRCSDQAYEAIRAIAPSAERHIHASAVTITRDERLYGAGTIAVVSAGTADIPVAEEAAVTARIMGNRVETMYDIGVAGLHRLIGEAERLMRASVVIVVAGMEGALPSVIGGMVSAPVIAVPTSVGYGTGIGGLAALLAMLNSCASNVAVVNIDNGFGAGYVASLINRRRPLVESGEINP